MCHAVRLGKARRERDGRGVGRPGERSAGNVEVTSSGPLAPAPKPAASWS